MHKFMLKTQVTKTVAIALELVQPLSLEKKQWWGCGWKHAD